MNTVNRAYQIDAIIECQEMIPLNERLRLCQELHLISSFSEGLQKVYDTQVKIDLFICNNLLSRPIQTQNEWLLMNDFFDKLPKKLLSIHNYTAFLKQASLQVGNFDKVEALFEEAKKIGKTNITIYELFMDIAVKKGKFEEARTAFMEATQAGFAVTPRMELLLKLS
jgi:hypothetical protein